MNEDLFYKWQDDCLILNVLGTPAAKLDAIGKIKGNQLKVSVTAEPKGGKATLQMIKFLAKKFGVSKKDIEVIFGMESVNKQFKIKNPKLFPCGIVKD
ncbi:MAG: DUF167 domain-containing protein [Chitinophagaceae bacterium]|nr:DUF167 domain-containing protein [Chitinophagaceae bacterium]